MTSGSLRASLNAWVPPSNALRKINDVGQATRKKR